MPRFIVIWTKAPAFKWFLFISDIRVSLLISFPPLRTPCFDCGNACWRYSTTWKQSAPIGMNSLFICILFCGSGWLLSIGKTTTGAIGAQIRHPLGTSTAARNSRPRNYFRTTARTTNCKLTVYSGALGILFLVFDDFDAGTRWLWRRSDFDGFGCFWHKAASIYYVTLKLDIVDPFPSSSRF